VVGQEKRPEKRRIPWLFGLLVLIFLVVLILLQSSNLWKTFSVETASDTLLLYALSSLNFFAFVIFGFIFLRSILKLARERRSLQLGSRIKTRLLVYFAAVSLLPIVAMAGFSYLFMNRALERWFTQIPENVVREAQDVQQKAISEQSERLRETAAMIARSLEGRTVSEDEIGKIGEAGNLTHIEVAGASGSVAASRPIDPLRQDEFDRIISTARSGNLTNPALSDGNGFDVATARLADGRRLIIVPDLRSGESVGQMVDSALLEFDKLKDQQVTVRQIGFLTLGVLTFLLIFASSWVAFYIARGITTPIKALAEGANEIAAGNLKHRVEVIAEDELVLLVDAFNEMSSRLEANSTEIGERRRYIETVLQTLPTGVVSVNENDRVSTINRAALQILGIENKGNKLIGRAIEELVNEDSSVIVERIVRRARRIGHASDQTELRLTSGENGHPADSVLPVSLTAASLDKTGGVVLVIEDLSELIAAQRASAWQEVARRMAHEIKNPLTPIQLSAERIAKRFDGDSANGGSSVHMSQAPSGTDERTMQIVEEGTRTILREVRSLKAMVDEFSRFARLPETKLSPGNLNDVINETIGLYKDRLGEVEIASDLATELPMTMLDREQLKRVFVNLIDNAIEAFSDEQEAGSILIASRQETARDILVAEVSDNGKGIPPSEIQRLFQPYFSTKGRGTGLGLAIVQRIVSEHGGKIKAVANQPKGARFIIELPVLG
jgi:two-component system, NtrC family, nitrogen regulation sensor histidine kinase NtrY